MRINTNITALNTYNSYTSANNKIADSVSKLSSGYAINSAADNAAGLAISEKMRAQIRGLDKASSNSQEAISLVQTAEGALESSGEILQRMREISVQSASDTNENEIDRDALQAEFSQLQKELDDISADTTYNNQNLLDGSLSSTRKAVSAQNLKGTGMTVELGNANDGSYAFTVSTKVTSAAVKAEAPDELLVSNNTVNDYFSSATIAAGSNIAASALLNGNYEISGATVGDDGSISVTVKGDNNQSFTANISQATIDAGITNAAGVKLTFNAEADDAFSLTFKPASDIAADPSDATVQTLADAFVGTKFSIDGGVTAKDAESAAYANMTGAQSVKLEVGMSSVSFDNGVTVNFDKLSASDVDTTNKGTAALSGTAAVAIMASATGTVADTASQQVVIPQAYTVAAASAAGTTTFTATGADTTTIFTGKIATADIVSKVDTTFTVDFFDDKGVAAFSVEYTTGATGTGAASDTDFAATVTVAGTGHNYDSTFGSTAAASTFDVQAKNNDGLTIQVGANSGDSLEINIDRADAQYLGVESLNVSTQESATAAIDVVNSAINQVSSQRAYLGAIENRLDYKIDNLKTSSENLTAAESSIRDVDMASEMTSFTNANILSQAATAMLAQANSLPQNVLSLLG